MSTMPTQNSVAPGFSLPDQTGKTLNLSDYSGQKVALYFYPKDQTPGCTTQACNLRDNYQSLTKQGIVVLGVSPDSVSSHVKFQKKESLPFTLLADPEHVVLEKYGVWAEKSLYGRDYMGVVRTTFLIDESGKIVKVIDKPEVGNHAAEILAGFGLK